MMMRLRDTIRDLFRPGGLRRHPALAAIALAVVAFIVIGLVLRPL